MQKLVCYSLFCFIFGCHEKNTTSITNADSQLALQKVVQLNGKHLTRDGLESITLSLRGRTHPPLTKKNTIDSSLDIANHWGYCSDQSGNEFINPSILIAPLLSRGQIEEAVYFNAMSNFYRWLTCVQPRPDSLRFAALSEMQQAYKYIHRDSLAYFSASDSLRFLSGNLLEIIKIQSDKLVSIAVSEKFPRGKFFHAMESGCKYYGGCAEVQQILTAEPSNCKSSALLFCGSDSIYESQRREECRCAPIM